MGERLHMSVYLPVSDLMCTEVAGLLEKVLPCYRSVFGQAWSARLLDLL